MRNSIYLCVYLHRLGNMLIIPQSSSTTSQTIPPPFDQIRIRSLVDIKERNELGEIIRVSFKETALHKYQKHMTRGREKVAKVMVADLFSDEERSSCNCNGRAGKPPLDPVRLEAIRKLCLRSCHARVMIP